MDKGYRKEEDLYILMLLNHMDNKIKYIWAGRPWGERPTYLRGDEIYQGTVEDYIDIGQ